MTKKSAVELDMHKYKEGKLHSGSKHGPVVKSPKQAIAIGLSQAREKGEKVSPMKKHKALHGGAHNTGHHSLAHSTLRSKAPMSTHNQPAGKPTGEHTNVAKHMAAHTGLMHHEHSNPNKAKHHPAAPKEPHRFDRPPTVAAHGFGHAAHQRHGHLRVSGTAGAHRVGKK
jgi:hypothetical protein